MTHRGVYVLFAVWLFVGLICNDVSNYGSVRLLINVRLDRVLWLVLVLAALAHLSKRGRLFRLNAEEWVMLAFFAIMLTSCIVSGSINNPRNRYISNLFNFGLIPASLFMIGRRLEPDPDAMAAQFRWLLYIALYLGFTGVFEHFDLSFLVFPQYILDPSIGYHYGRSRGPFVQAVIMGCATNLLFFLLLWYYRFVRRSILCLIGLGVSLATSYFSNTRSVWLQFAAMTAVMFLFSKQLRKPILVVMGCLTLVFFSGVASKFSAYETTLFKRRGEQVDDRINIAYASLRMFKERPLFGFGYGMFAEKSGPYFTKIQDVEFRGRGEGQHHTILGLLADLGLVGTIPFLWLYYRFIKRCYRESRHNPNLPPVERELVIAALAFVVGMLALMQLGDIRDFNFVNNVVFWMLGVAYSVSERPARDQVMMESESPSEDGMLAAA